ncbi:WhiB family transcriptional regulator [Knoellia koreensis]|uniref:WhiB family transcriptional regulator n=1 Tax=Knoellia koreensis TaxID=2730921 RepID=A0A849HD71_9MICO|nr:WhiB family transcriptional regulator [Knoellia sp. DB2414S]NNM44593.1 WhiB family transcriptional regulator [Knoellia sp. DB2414S]
MPEAWWSSSLEAEAVAVCRSCPVARECLAYALAAGERDGVWGGFTNAERRGLAQ